MSDIVNTGERILLEKESALMIARHLSAYKFAQCYCRGKKVLDVGCGEGYGSNYLAESASSVLGLDYNQDVINYARQKYKRNNLEFRVQRIEELGSLGEKFDCICSFQVIEHIKDAGAFLDNIKRLLGPGGIFICSTPNRLDASPNSSKPHNKFHVREYLYLEFDALLEKYFGSRKIFGLKRGRKLNFYRRLKKIGICNFLPVSLDPVKKFYSCINTANFVLVEREIESALDFIAVSRDM